MGVVLRDVPPAAHGGVPTAPRASLEPSRGENGVLTVSPEGLQEGPWGPDTWCSTSQEPPHSSGHRRLSQGLCAHAYWLGQRTVLRETEKLPVDLWSRPTILRATCFGNGCSPYLWWRGLGNFPVEKGRQPNPALDSGFCLPLAPGPLAQGSVLQPQFSQIESQRYDATPHPVELVWGLRDVTHEKCPACAWLTGASQGRCLLMRRPVQPSWAPWLSRCLWSLPWGRWALGSSARLPPSPTLTAFPGSFPTATRRKPTQDSGQRRGPTFVPARRREGSVQSGQGSAWRAVLKGSQISPSPLPPSTC